MLTVREILATDIPLITSYWLDAAPSFLEGMGVDLAKMPKEHEWQAMLTEQINTPMAEKKSYCFIWLLNGVPVGHSNINKIIPGKEAYMHLHLWQSDNREKGMGVQFVAMTIPHFFEAYRLKRIYSEPYALNPAPNKTLQKAGFEFVHQITTTPGRLNFEQLVNVWCLTIDKYISFQHGVNTHYGL